MMLKAEMSSNEIIEELKDHVEDLKIKQDELKRELEETRKNYQLLRKMYFTYRHRCWTLERMMMLPKKKRWELSEPEREDAVKQMPGNWEFVPAIRFPIEEEETGRE